MIRLARFGIAALVAAACAPHAFAAKASVKEAYGVRWQPSLEAAIEAASRPGRAAKPIALFRILGALEGAT